MNVEKLEASCNENLNLTYNIEYLGGSFEPFNCEIGLNSSGEFDINGKPSYPNESFIIYQPKPIHFLVKYPKNGKYYLPSLTIIGKRNLENSNNYTFSEKEIDIKDYFQMNGELIGWELAIIGIIIGQIYGDSLRKSTTSFKKVLSNIGLFDPIINYLRYTIFAPSICSIKRFLKYKDPP